MSRHVVVALLTLAMLVGLTLAVDSVTAAPTRSVAGEQGASVVNSGTWYCPIVADEDDQATVTVGAVGDEPTHLTVERFIDGERSFDPTTTLEPGKTETIEVAAGDRPPGVVIRWRGGPAVASWQAERKRERIGSLCSASPSPRWVISGLDTTLGSGARLFLFNPFESDAVARLSFATPEGGVDLVSTENIPVRAGSVVGVNIGEVQPEQPDLGLRIEVEAGRLVPVAVQRFGQPDEPSVDLEDLEDLDDEEQPPEASGPQGRTIVPAAPGGASSAGFAYAAIGEATDSWLSVMNPSSSHAMVEVRVTDPIQESEELAEVTIPPETIERIQLDEVSSAPVFGVTVESTNDASVAANGFVAVGGNQPAVTAAAGVSGPDTTLAIPASDPGTAPEILLYNPGPEPSTAQLSVGGVVPPQWEAVELPPESVESLPLADAAEGEDLPQGPIVVTSDQPVLGTVRLADADDRFRSFLATQFATASLWRGPPDAPNAERDRTLETKPVDFPAEEQQE